MADEKTAKYWWVCKMIVKLIAGAKNVIFARGKTTIYAVCLRFKDHVHWLLLTLSFDKFSVLTKALRFT